MVWGAEVSAYCPKIPVSDSEAVESGGRTMLQRKIRCCSTHFARRVFIVANNDVPCPSFYPEGCCCVLSMKSKWWEEGKKEKR